MLTLLQQHDAFHDVRVFVEADLAQPRQMALFHSRHIAQQDRRAVVLGYDDVVHVGQ